MTGTELTMNTLLANLPASERRELAAQLDVLDVGLRHQVYRPNEPIEHLYFPLTSVFSMVAEMEHGVAVEVGTVGFEGFVGLPAFLGAVTSPHAAFCQVPGRAARISHGRFRAFLAHDGALHEQLHRFSQTTMIQLAQNVACNSMHNAEQRAARWLLTTSDRVRSPEFLLTQEFLSQMLGVRRATVSEVAGQLQERALIRYSRGRITVLDRPGLIGVSCGCYELLAAEFRGLRSGDEPA